MEKMANPGDRTKILLISRNLPPLVGGMERLIYNLAHGLKEYADLTVIGPKGCSRHLQPGTPVEEVPAALGGFLISSTAATFRLRNKSRFDLVIGGSGLTAPILRLASFSLGCKSMLLLHGLDIVVDNILYQSLFAPNLKKIDFVVANSRNTRKLAIAHGVEPGRITVINPGVEEATPVDLTLIEAFRNRIGIRFDRYMLFVGRMTKRKGLSCFLRNSLPRILEKVPDAGLVIVGDDPDHGLDGRGEMNEVHNALHETGLRNHVLFTGEISDDDLHICYSGADVLVLPLIDVPGDVEGFGMVAIEAAARGTPTVAFNLGGVSDAVSGNSGRLVNPDDYASFTDAVCHVMLSGEPDRDNCISHSKAFHWHRYHAHVRGIIAQVIGIQNENHHGTGS